MAIVNKATLKGFFEQGDIPTQGQYFNLIESTFNLAETDAQVLQGTISASVGDFEYLKFKKAFIPGIGVGSDGTDGAKVGTSFTIGDSAEISGSLNVTKGNVSASGTGIHGTGSFMTLNIVDYGSITASSHINAGGVTASNAEITNDILVRGTVTSTGNINANGNIVGDGSTAISSMASLGIGSVTATGTIQAEQITSTDDITATGTVTAEQITSTDDITAGGSFFGSNIGPYVSNKILLKPSDFAVSSVTTGKIQSNGAGIITATGAAPIYASYTIPIGHNIRTARIYGDSGVTVSILEGDIETETTNSLAASKTPANGEVSAISNTGDGTNYIIVELITLNTTNVFFGGYLGLVIS